MMGQRWSTALRVAGLIFSLMAGASCVSGAERTEADVHLFLSPYCGISQYRLAEAVGLFPSLEHRGGRVEFHLIALRGDREEVSMLQHLHCANTQGRFTPYFLFVSRAVKEGRVTPHEMLAQAVGLDRKAFHQCMHDTKALDTALERSRAFFDAFMLRGVPSVIVKDKAFTFRDMHEVLEELRD